MLAVPNFSFLDPALQLIKSKWNALSPREQKISFVVGVIFAVLTWATTIYKLDKIVRAPNEEQDLKIQRLFQQVNPALLSSQSPYDSNDATESFISMSKPQDKLEKTAALLQADRDEKAALQKTTHSDEILFNTNTFNPTQIPWEGGVYEGGWQNGQPEGSGKFIKDNVVLKEGRFVNGKLVEGKFFYRGNIYEGTFVRGFLNGQGRVTLSDGTVHEGSFCRDKLHGQGKITLANGEITEGWFDFGILNPVLTEERAKIEKEAPAVVEDITNAGYISFHDDILGQTVVYKGQTVDGKPHGHGSLTCECGTCSLLKEGQFDHGKLIQGKYVLKSGEVMEGLFDAKERLNGQGKKIVNEVIYEGTFIKGQLNGPGTITYPNGKIIQGPFKDDKPLVKEKGTIDWKDGQYTGELEDGEPNGQGKLTIGENVSYEGEFIKGKFNRGVACMFGTTYEGEFDADGDLFGKGKKTVPNGNVYEGEFRHNKLNGLGKLTYFGTDGDGQGNPIFEAGIFVDDEYFVDDEVI
jgi:hypothetical protein